jgi:hypothetical protein
MAAKGLDQWITNKLYTPIDLMSLWDKCMLHEMMHTTPAQNKQDVGGSGGYGWKNDKALAQTGKGGLNADSWALFGSALYWFWEGSPIDENDTFIEPTTKRQINNRRWLSSGPGRALDMIKVDAVKQFT